MAFESIGAVLLWGLQTATYKDVNDSCSLTGGQVCLQLPLCRDAVWMAMAVNKAKVVKKNVSRQNRQTDRRKEEQKVGLLYSTLLDGAVASDFHFSFSVCLGC